MNVSGIVRYRVKGERAGSRHCEEAGGRVQGSGTAKRQEAGSR
jgi:hypothetical protein